MDDEKIKVVVEVASFLVWAAEAKELYGGVHAEDALKNFSIMIGIPVEGLRKIVMPWLDK